MENDDCDLSNSDAGGSASADASSGDEVDEDKRRVSGSSSRSKRAAGRGSASQTPSVKKHVLKQGEKDVGAAKLMKVLRKCAMCMKSPPALPYAPLRIR